MKNIIVIIVSALPIVMQTSCKESVRNSCIQIDLSSVPMDPSEIDLDILTREVSLDNDSIIIGNIVDLVATDSVCFILDENGSIIRYPLADGISPKRINSRGHGFGEYIAPVALTSDKDTLYVLDIATASILKYDTDLKPLENVQLDHPAQNILICGDNILSDNLDLKSNSNMVIMSDRKGNHIDNLIPIADVGELDSYRVGNTFMERMQDDVFVLDSKGNTLYMYEDGVMHPAYRYDFGKRMIPEGKPLDVGNLSQYAVSTHCFISGDMVLLSYLLDNQRQYCYYDVKTGQIKNGTVNATSEGFPFFPRWQHGNELIGYLESESGEKNGSLLFYTLK